jgi:hypothetical protein
MEHVRDSDHFLFTKEDGSQTAVSFLNLSSLNDPQAHKKVSVFQGFMKHIAKRKPNVIVSRFLPSSQAQQLQSFVQVLSFVQRQNASCLLLSNKVVQLFFTDQTELLID